MNPKQRFGDMKPNLALVPGSALIYLALGLEPGAKKYGPFNWRINDVELMTYAAAALRHIVSWVDGEDFAVDSGRPHLAHALASLAILIDAEETGHYVDNRPPRGRTADIIQIIENERKPGSETAPRSWSPEDLSPRQEHKPDDEWSPEDLSPRQEHKPDDEWPAVKKRVAAWIEDRKAIEVQKAVDEAIELLKWSRQFPSDGY